MANMRIRGLVEWRVVFGFKIHDSHDPKGGENITISATATADEGAEVEAETGVEGDKGVEIEGECEGEAEVDLMNEEV